MGNNMDNNTNNINNNEDNSINNSTNHITVPPTSTEAVGKRFTLRLFDTESDVTRSVHLSLRAVRMLAVGAGA